MIDHSVYPDVDVPPTHFDTIADQADYVDRICGAWDFGIIPTPETFLLFSTWREVFDSFPLLHSPAYAAFRSGFGWTPVLGGSVLQAHYERHNLRSCGEPKAAQDLCLKRMSSLTFPNQTRASLRPQRPIQIHSIADAILRQVCDIPEAQHLVLGGAFALQCYLNDRATHTLQVGWAQPFSESEQRLAVERLRSIVQQVSETNGLMLGDRPTRTGMVLRLKREGDLMFSVQILERAGELEPSIVSPWSPIRLESLHDAIGSRMTALVEHGSPCDFCDIRAVVTAEVATVEEVWKLWQHQNPDLDLRSAKLLVLTHLESIVLRHAVSRALSQQAAICWFYEALLGCA